MRGWGWYRKLCGPGQALGWGWETWVLLRLVQVLKELEYLFPFLASMCLSVNEVASWIPLVPQAVARSPISCVLGIP